jgi:hypothetical protein
MVYRTRRFNAAFTRALQLSLSWAEWTPFPALIPWSSRSILILSSHLRLGLPKGLFSLGLPVRILTALLPSSILATFPAHLKFFSFNHLDYIRWTIHSMTFLIVEHFSLPILISLESKYTPQDPVFLLQSNQREIEKKRKIIKFSLLPCDLKHTQFFFSTVGLLSSSFCSFSASIAVPFERLR